MEEVKEDNIKTSSIINGFNGRFDKLEKMQEKLIPSVHKTNQERWEGEAMSANLPSTSSSSGMEDQDDQEDRDEPEEPHSQSGQSSIIIRNEYTKPWKTIRKKKKNCCIADTMEFSWPLKGRLEEFQNLLCLHNPSIVMPMKPFGIIKPILSLKITMF